MVLTSSPSRRAELGMDRAPQYFLAQVFVELGSLSVHSAQCGPTLKTAARYSMRSYFVEDRRRRCFSPAPLSISRRICLRGPRWARSRNRWGDCSWRQRLLEIRPVASVVAGNLQDSR